MGHQNILQDLTPVDAATGNKKTLFTGMCMLLGINIVDSVGAPVNDSTLTLWIQEPTAATATAVLNGSLTNPTTGRYEYQYTLLEGGNPFFRWFSSGVTIGATEFQLTVQHPQLTSP